MNTWEALDTKSHIRPFVSFTQFKIRTFVLLLKMTDNHFISGSSLVVVYYFRSRKISRCCFF